MGLRADVREPSGGGLLRLPRPPVLDLQRVLVLLNYYCYMLVPFLL